MALKKITLTEDHIKLISNIRFETFMFDGITSPPSFWSMLNASINTGRNVFLQDNMGWGIDQYSPWGGYRPIEDIALILGKWDEVIEGTEEDPMGRRYPEELEKYFLEIYHDIVDNMEYILSLVFTYSSKGGLTPGTYKCHPLYKNWTKEEES